MPTYNGTSAFSAYTLETTGVASVTFSHDQSLIYVARRNGYVDVYDRATHALVTSWTVGFALGGMSLSEDGTFLLVTEEPLKTSISPPSTVPPVVHRLSTIDGSVQNYTDAAIPQGSFHDVEIVDAHTAILSGTQMAKLNLDTGTFSPLTGATYLSSAQSVLVEDQHLTLIAEPGNSNAPLFIYDDRTGTITASSTNSGINWGHQAISEAAGQVAQFHANDKSINLYDLSLHLTGSVSIGQEVDGLAYDSSGTYFYAYLINSGVLAKYSVATFALVDQISVGTSHWHNHIGSGDQIHVSDDGNYITLSDTDSPWYSADNSKLQVIDLTARNEFFAGTSGADTFYGNDGNDTYVVNNVGDLVIEAAAKGTDSVQTTLSSYTLPANVENLTFVGIGSFVGTGNVLDNILNASSATGDVQLFGAAGNDTLFGSSGNDVLDGGTGHDLMAGGGGSDTYIVDNVGDVVVENINEGQDTIVTSLDNYVLSETGNIENLYLVGNAITGSGNSLNNALIGNALDNTLYGNDGNDVLAGGAGADTIVGGDGDDILFSQNLDPYAYAFVSYPGISTDFGTEVDTLIGGNGDDYIYAGYGDNIDGGAQGFFGNRLFISFQGATSGVNADFRLLQTQSSITIGGGVITNIQSVGYLEGSQYDDLLAPIDSPFGPGATVYGRGGNDRLISGAGDDTLIGGTGNDTYVVDSLGDVVVENANEGSDTIETALSYSLAGLADVENLTLTGTAAVDATGNALANVLTGNSAANMLIGNGGADTLIGGLGDDYYVVTDSSTVIVELAGEGNDTVRSSVSYVLGTGVSVETMRLMGVASVNLTGNADYQVLAGNAGNNVLDSGGGGDRMKGVAGDDTYIIRSAADSIVEVAGDGDDTAKAAVSYTLGAAAQVEHLVTLDATATTAINLTGNAYSHDIEGNAGANVLTGGSGADTIIGNGGADTLIGGLGDDYYVITDSSTVIVELAGEGNDTIRSSVSYVLGTGVSVETVRLMGAASVNLTGNADYQVLAGNGGNNVLDSGGGGDRMKGVAGDDTYIIRSAADSIVEVAGDGDDTAKAAVSYTLGAAAQVEHLVTLDATATTAINLTGNAYSHDIQGNAGANVLTGGSGDDVLKGFAGNDTLFGGGGADLFVFDHGTGQDVVGDFVTGSDRLDLSAFGFASFQDVQTATHDDGSGYAVIDLGNGDTVMLMSVAAAQLHSGDFIL